MAFPEWAIGVILITFGSLGNNLGNNLVSMGHKEIKEKKRKESCGDELEVTNAQSGGELSNMQGEGEVPEIKKPERTCSWRLLGTIIFVLGNLFTFAAFGFGAQSLLASLESIQFVSNLVFAKYCHNEPVTIRMMIATFSIVAGNILVVIFAQHNATLYDSGGMIHLYVVNTAYHAYMVAAFCVWAITNWIYQHYYHSRTKLRVMLWEHNFIEPFCYAMSSAIVGTQAVLNSKCMSMLIQVSARGERNEFETWYIWFILVTWIMMVAYWLRRLDLGLELFPPLFIIPVMQVFFVFFAILCGGIYFEEFTHFKAKNWIGFIVGVVMILSGVYGLAPTDMKLNVPDDIIVPISQNTSGKGIDLEAGKALMSNEDKERDEFEMSNRSGKDRPTTCQSEEHVLDNIASPVVKEKPGFSINTAEEELNIFTRTDSPEHKNSLNVDPLGLNVPSNAVILAPIELTSTPMTNSKKNRKVVKRSVSELEQQP